MGMDMTWNRLTSLSYRGSVHAVKTVRPHGQSWGHAQEAADSSRSPTVGSASLRCREPRVAVKIISESPLGVVERLLAAPLEANLLR